MHIFVLKRSFFYSAYLFSCTIKKRKFKLLEHVARLCNDHWVKKYIFKIPKITLEDISQKSKRKSSQKILMSRLLWAEEITIEKILNLAKDRNCCKKMCHSLFVIQRTELDTIK